jgi:hypothetical protein
MESESVSFLLFLISGVKTELLVSEKALPPQAGQGAQKIGKGAGPWVEKKKIQPAPCPQPPAPFAKLHVHPAVHV